MKFSLATAGLLATSVAAVQFDNSDYSVTSGAPIVLKWSGASGPVTITLKNGPTGNLGTVEVIDSSDSGSSFSWTPPADLASGTYAFQITDSSGSNYSPQFTYSGNPTGTLGLTGASTMASITASGSSSASASASMTMTMTTTVMSSSSSASSTGSASTSATTASSSSSKSSATSSSTSSSASASSTKPANANDGQRIASSPLAIILATIAGLIYFN